MNTFWQGIYYKTFRSSSKIYLLIAINVFVFLVINIPSVIEQLFAQSDVIKSYAFEYLALPAYLPKLLTRFWTPLTYMFMHSGVFQLLFNMLWLYWIGQIFEEFLGYKRILGLYILAGLAGALLYVIGFNTIPAYRAILPINWVADASVGVIAIVVAAATIVPDFSIMLFGIINIKLKWIAAFYVVVNLLDIVGTNAGADITHLGGALLGFIYVKQLQRGNDWVGSIASIFKKRSKLKVVSNNKGKNASGKPRQDEVDRILDKISKSGYDNLSQQEKEILFRASNNES